MEDLSFESVPYTPDSVDRMFAEVDTWYDPSSPQRYSSDSYESILTPLPKLGPPRRVPRRPKLGPPLRVPVSPIRVSNDDPFDFPDSTPYKELYALNMDNEPIRDKIMDALLLKQRVYDETMGRTSSPPTPEIPPELRRRLRRTYVTPPSFCISPIRTRPITYSQVKRTPGRRVSSPRRRSRRSRRRSPAKRSHKFEEMIGGPWSAQKYGRRSRRSRRRKRRRRSKRKKRRRSKRFGGIESPMSKAYQNKEYEKERKEKEKRRKQKEIDDCMNTYMFNPIDWKRYGCEKKTGRKLRFGKRYSFGKLPDGWRQAQFGKVPFNFLWKLN